MRDKTVFVLGAGFSVPCGFPDGRGLFKTAIENSGLADGIKHELECRGYTFEGPFNYEDFLTDLDLEIQFLNDLKCEDRSWYERRCEALERMKDSIRMHMLSELIKRDNLFYNKTDILPHIGSVIEQARRKNATVISFNYDLCLERTCLKLDCPIYYEQTDKTGEDGIVLFKLHGSISWTATPSTYLKPSQYITKFGTHIVTDHNLGPHIVNAGIANDDDYKLIYPTTLKRFNGSELLKKTWQQAFDCMAHAKIIHILGYSMPSGDIPSMTMFRSTCGGGSKPEKVVVWDKSVDKELYDKYQNVFGDQVVFKSCDFSNANFKLEY